MSGLIEPLRTYARNLPRACAAMGFQARVTSGYRSPAKQAKLYQRYLAGLQPYPVAPPGTSDHEQGLAIDVVTTDIARLVTLLGMVGLSWAGPDDPVHFSIKPRKSQTRAISEASKSWAAGPGSAIPSWAGSLPIVGAAFQIAKDPWGAAKAKGQTLLTAVTRGWL